MHANLYFSHDDNLCFTLDISHTFFILCTVNYYLCIFYKRINTGSLIINVRIHKTRTNYEIIMNEKKLFVSFSYKIALRSTFLCSLSLSLSLFVPYIFNELNQSYFQ